MLLLEQYGITVKMFAGDAKVYSKIVNDVDIVRLQAAVDPIIAWSDMWQLAIFCKRCVLNIGIPVCDTSIRVDDTVL
jgi:hypothetical protein